MARGRKAVTRGRMAHRAGQASPGSSNVAEQVQAKGFKMSTLDPGQAPNPAKRTPRKAAARGKWSEEQLLTSDKSELITKDLVKLLARPESWNVLEENEKREILALLPADTHPDADLTADYPDARIPPIPDSFVRYSNNWRAGIRQFQVDLENGRYDPEWLRQAESARQQREKGDFDAFKEREFEQFWGQKQKMDMRAFAGECAHIRLGTLLQAGVILPGDVWRYTFVFGKGADRILIDKEVKVHEINGSKMTFVIPTGTRAFLTGETEKPDQATEKEENQTGPPKATFPVQSDSASPQETDSAPIQTKKDTPISDKESEAPETREMPPPTPCTPLKEKSQDNISSVQVVIMSSGGNSRAPTDGLKRGASESQQPSAEPPVKRKRGRPRKTKPVEPEPEIEEPIVGEAGAHEPNKANIDPVRRESLSSVKGSSDTQPLPETYNTNENLMDTATDAAEQNVAASSPLSEPSEDLTPPASQPIASDSGDIPTASVPNEIIVPNIASPNMLVTKILQIDGRPKEGARTANAWKEIRCFRKNQDMGSLWDVRQVWYLKQQGKK